jgi:hypothetical protein
MKIPPQQESRCLAWTDRWTGMTKLTSDIQSTVHKSHNTQDDAEVFLGQTTFILCLRHVTMGTFPGVRVPLNSTRPTYSVSPYSVLPTGRAPAGTWPSLACCHVTFFEVTSTCKTRKRPTIQQENSSGVFLYVSSCDQLMPIFNANHESRCRSQLSMTTGCADCSLSRSSIRYEMVKPSYSFRKCSYMIHISA